ncbi:dTDP-4-dehydrorhamnose reductase [Vibrio parahaemolyticus]|uniref:dTDP-4-dehydrorhamnose reductase n=1 Tax=Vibrio parahaemolyticus TaxID=670 RepID=UPI00186974F8|nr:dTDP-4-dehydrorhamnose reductase [Vibrio parahaemolyticus]EHH1222511.1 dTDP-4-dehydrorhamnose reductase [Vibrio parahaemolyticus]EIY8172761.1 dTDP-4-dehydrorhamnose reductase [Vibrio parahaemolyticus]EIY8250551.1 dTDP-4-dehydrorhamnose reductase [Vibrio parahaemolyticus]ELA8140975.1 dTDP-4-dehydrorhamnose reductase [Vibrio parahaemolyticus]MBE4002207.1 dTDP-4-dehydrorhamnose reductase [Vibrio parahaemolyticus]
MRVLVTGCNGQVGHCLTEILSNTENVSFLAVDREELDITEQEAVSDLVNSFKPTIIINAAAYTAVDKAEEEVELSFAINRDGPKYLAEAAQQVGAVIFHISTDYVFEGNKLGEYVESDSTNPQGVYGASKLAGEIEIAKACDKHIILRTAWVFGEHGNNFVKTMLRLGTVRTELSIVGDQFGGPTYAGDIARVLLDIANRISRDETVEFGIYHFSGLPHTSWCEFAEAIFDAAVKEGVFANKPKISSINTALYPTPAKRPSNSKLSTKKVMDAFEIEASNWKTALTNIKAYME